MALPMFLAMTAGEMAASGALPQNPAWMACHFSPYTQGITNLPRQLPAGSLLILDDRFPCQGHSADLVAQELEEAVRQLDCGSVLLDFQRPPNPESTEMAERIIHTLPCPVGVTAPYIQNQACPVFLSPAPLHTPLEDHITPWQGREIWLEAALCQEDAVITREGTSMIPLFPPEELESGFYSEILCCRYRVRAEEDRITFTLFDTPESLREKLKKARSLGVTRAVGLYQELRELS